MGEYTRQPSRLGRLCVPPYTIDFGSCLSPKSLVWGTNRKKIFKKPEKTPQIHERMFYFWRSCP